MKTHYIEKLIAEGEHQQLDFKFEIADARKIARTFAAFSNSSGGKLLIGVNDNGTISGIKSLEEKFMADKAGNIYTKPVIKFKTKNWMIMGKNILEITIPEGNAKPYFAQDYGGKWFAYIRFHDQNFLANRVLVNAWNRKNRFEGVYIHYTNTEKVLLEYLGANPCISVTKFTKLGGISKYKAENILSNFIALDIIRVDIINGQFVYGLQHNN